MFYDRFKTLCDEKGVTCTKAACEIGLSNSTPTKWKKTEATPDGATLFKIADYFGISIDHLLLMTVEGTNDGEGKPMANLHLTDAQVEQEIARLRKSEHVALAKREERVRYARRQLLYNLRSLEKKGRELEASGITMDVLNGLEREEEEYSEEYI